MAVYVDHLFVAVSRDPQAARVGARNDHQWCHLWTEPGNEEELHRVAKAAGMRREWFQPKPDFPHYDLVPSRRIKALRAGATETDLREWLRARRAQ